ncbi:MAG: hypothetical protein ACT452_05800 [Microthrixaceae bacterium]
MIKRILAGAAAAGVAATLLVSGSATAAPCNTTGAGGQTPPSGKGETVVVAPVTGTRVYRTPGTPSTGGYIGVQGSSGWIEANGSASPTGGYIAGKVTGQPVDGRISGTMNPDNAKVCVAERPLK